MATFPGAISTDSDLYIAVNQKTTQLTDNPLTVGATTANVVSTSGFPSVGFISIDAEIIKYTGITATSFTGLTRASDGSTAASHAQNSQVYHNVIAIHHNVLKDEIKAEQQFISDLIGRTNTQIRTPNGSAAAPSHGFSSDTTSGMFLAGASSLSFSAGGTVYANMSADTIMPGTDDLTVIGSAAKRYKTILMANGSVTNPTYSFGASTGLGIYRSAADEMTFTAAGVAKALISTTIFQSNIDFTSVRANSGANVTIKVNNSSNTANSHSLLYAEVPGSSAGDALASFAIAGGQSWSCGLDNSDSDRWKLSSSTALGTNDCIIVDTTRAVSIYGTTTNDSAATGFVGELVESAISSGASVALVSGTAKTITSISLTAGDWDIFGLTGYLVSGGSQTVTLGGSSLTNNAVGAETAMFAHGITLSGDSRWVIPSFRYSLSGTTTVYLIGQSTFTGTVSAFGRISARRRR